MTKGMIFRLDSFEGPLDLLLHLIAKNKVSIYDIPIASLLNQYMDVLHEAQSLDMDVAGDFIAMAAQLLYIKSKMLLPSDEENEEDPRIQLVEMLLEYQRFKQVSTYFKEKTDLGRDILIKAPEILQKSKKMEYHHKPEDLTRAARAMLSRANRRLPPPVSSFSGIVGRETAPVGDKIAMIWHLFLKNTRLSFHRLFEKAGSRSEIVATFLAVLELSKTRRVLIEGEGEETELILAPLGSEET